MLISDFISIVFRLVAAGRWKELSEFFALVRELLNRPTATIVAGIPKDKEIK